MDKVIKLGRDSRDNTGWVEAQLKGEAQPASGNCLLSIPRLLSGVSQPWHYWHWALHNPLLYSDCRMFSGIPTLYSLYARRALLVFTAKIVSGHYQCLLGGKTFHAPRPTALNRCTLYSKGNTERNKQRTNSTMHLQTHVFRGFLEICALCAKSLQSCLTLQPCGL